MCGPARFTCGTRSPTTYRCPRRRATDAGRLLRRLLVAAQGGRQAPSLHPARGPNLWLAPEAGPRARPRGRGVRARREDASDGRRVVPGEAPLGLRDDLRPAGALRVLARRAAASTEARALARRPVRLLRGRAVTEIVSRRFVVCPGCGDDRHFDVEHLFDGTERRFGPWSCRGEDCLVDISGTVHPDGTIEVEAKVNPARRRGFALLKLRDLYLVRKESYGRVAPENADYFYHSHQCPTNLL